MAAAVCTLLSEQQMASEHWPAMSLIHTVMLRGWALYSLRAMRQVEGKRRTAEVHSSRMA